MTTIFYNSVSKKLYGDTLGDYGGTPWEVEKIFRIDRDGYALFGGAGTYDSVITVRNWLIAGCSEPKPSLDENFHGIVISNSGAIYHLEQALHFTPVRQAYWVVGSGRDLVTGAHLSGASDITAMQIAIDHDVYSGGRLSILELTAPEADDDIPF